VLPAFEKDIVNVLYEADANCLPQMMEYWNEQPSDTVVLPYCLSDRDGDGKFHLNYDPYTNSYYRMNPRYAEFYYPRLYGYGGYDYVVGDMVRTMEDVQLPMTTLDSVVLDRGEVRGPDFLSLDTQGSELDILNGASRLLDTTILAVQSEVELQPLYEGQPLFGDICRFLAQHNFDLVNMREINKWHPKRGKIGFRGDWCLADGEALFLKRPETVETSVSGVQLNKLAFIATVLGQFEYAQKCFELKGFKAAPTLQSEATGPQPRYLDFISRLAGAVALLPERPAPLFSDVYSYERSKARFQTGAAQLQFQPPPQSALKKYVKSIRPMVSVFRGLRTLLERFKALVRLKLPDSTVEALFLEFGMKEQYLLAKRNRVLDTLSRPGQYRTFLHKFL